MGTVMQRRSYQVEFSGPPERAENSCIGFAFEIPGAIFIYCSDVYAWCPVLKGKIVRYKKRPTGTTTSRRHDTHESVVDRKTNVCRGCRSPLWQECVPLVHEQC
jgi:hypothetical protein